MLNNGKTLNIDKKRLLFNSPSSVTYLILWYDMLNSPQN